MKWGAFWRGFCSVWRGWTYDEDPPLTRIKRLDRIQTVEEAFRADMEAVAGDMWRALGVEPPKRDE